MVIEAGWTQGIRIGGGEHLAGIHVIDDFGIGGRVAAACDRVAAMLADHVRADHSMLAMMVPAVPRLRLVDRTGQEDEPQGKRRNFAQEGLIKSGSVAFILKAVDFKKNARIRPSLAVLTPEAGPAIRRVHAATEFKVKNKRLRLG